MTECLVFALVAISYPAGVALETHCMPGPATCEVFQRAYVPEGPAVDWVIDCMRRDDVRHAIQYRLYKGTEAGK